MELDGEKVCIQISSYLLTKNILFYGLLPWEEVRRIWIPYSSRD